MWAVVGDFGGLGGWLPGVDSCRVEGDDRHLAMMGMEITEHLVRKDDAERQIVYGITDVQTTRRWSARRVLRHRTSMRRALVALKERME